jgi:Cu/Ag efflux protein CusF
MKKIAIALSVALSLAGAHVALADQHQKAEAAPQGEIGQVVEVEATVTAIDQKTRKVTVKGPEGKEMTFVADERARNLAQVKVGDVVRVAYVESLAWKVDRSKKTVAAPEVETAAGRTKAGEMPGGAVAQRVTATVSVEAIDLANGTVTLKGPQGNSRTIKARNPANLQKVKVGDIVDITYTEALALKVEPAAKK